jgi:hypothetical protein
LLTPRFLSNHTLPVIGGCTDFAGYRTKSGSMPINSSALLWARSATANSATNEFDARYSLAANATSGFHSIECQVSPRYSLLSKTP